LLDVLQVNTQPRLLPKSRVDCLGKREPLHRLTGDSTYLSSGRQCDSIGFGIVSDFGLPEADWAWVGRRRDYLLGRWEFLANVETHRRENSVGEASPVAVALVAATEWRRQQEKSEEL
jgi:hypothetical protein